jgi:hypothetical protein
MSIEAKQQFCSTRDVVSPQAWASGALILMLLSVLGVRPSAQRKELNIINPTMPEWLDSLHIRNLRVGNSRVGLISAAGTSARSATWSTSKAKSCWSMYHSGSRLVLAQRPMFWVAHFLGAPRSPVVG